MYHYIQALVEERELKIELILSLSIFADNFTKAFFIGLFKEHHDKWGLID